MLELIVVLVIIGVALYFMNSYVPMAQPIKVGINVIVALCLIVYVLQGFGIIGPLPIGHRWR